MIPNILINTIKTTSGLMFLVGMANIFAWILKSEQIPQLIAHWILSLTENKYIMLLLINFLLLFVGTFMETIVALVILFPTLLGVVIMLGIDPVHFGVIVVLNLVIGLTTPPMVKLFVIFCFINNAYAV